MKIHQLFFMVLSLVPFLRAEVAKPTTPEESFGGEHRVRIMREATICEAQRIGVQLVPDTSDPSNPFAFAYIITPRGAPNRLSEDTLRLLKQTLIRDYAQRAGQSGCLPEPGVRFLFKSKEETASVLVCFHCGHVIVEEGGKIVGDRVYTKPMDDLKKVVATFLSPEEMAKLP